MIGKIPKMNKVEMVRSDVSGKLFPASECEVVIIKVIKHGKEDINDYQVIREMHPLREVVVETGKPATEVRVPAMDTSSPDYNKAVQIKHSIIPKHMQDLFAPPPGM